jgi:glucose-6-phosphate dehydrogenase assembly protein OpcA
MDRSLMPQSAIVPLGTTSPRPLDLQALRADLTALWREEGRGVSRACHATLVLLVSPGEDPEPLLEDLILTHPSRVLRVERDPKLPAGEMVAWASGSCMKRSWGNLVCSETIHFRAGSGAESRLPSVIRSLAVGGVPLAVICREASPLRLGWIEEVREDVDLIVGRSGALDRSQGLELWKQATAPGQRPRVEDLSWEELDPWRHAVQSSFDRAVEIPHLAALSGVTIQVGKHPGSMLEALLFLGWLGSRLDWTEPRSLDARRLRVRHRKGGTEIHLEGSGQGAGLLSVTFSFEDGRESLGWSLPSGAGSNRVPAESPGAPLSRILHQHEGNHIALAARKQALRLTEAWEHLEMRQG